MRYSLYQMEIKAGDADENRRKVKDWADEVCKGEEKPDILVLPEMWTTGYTLEELDERAEEDGAETIPFLKGLAKQHDVHMIGGSVANKKAGGIYNSAFVVNAKGELVYSYDKIHLVPMLNEPAFLTGGEEKVAVFELDGVKMGVIVCYDLRFPELARQLALDGAQVLHIVAEWPDARSTHWEVLQQARAIENQFYVVSVNCVGGYNGTTYAGRSMVTNPWGECLVKGDARAEETLSLQLNLEQTKQIRKDVPVFKSRRPEFY
ncbi:carbon-nitrogen family hydrolase [Shouchella shacheensis]|uniref:carbon-nitrogen family hydrolase n=1 Tax=Shouchella shacheensis TaxID=1649580 RepID=UPI00074048B3|nr:carbon-nitrogen family hydrolase [Shouchella shacheensis]